MTSLDSAYMSCLTDTEPTGLSQSPWPIVDHRARFAGTHQVTGTLSELVWPVPQRNPSRGVLRESVGRNLGRPDRMPRVQDFVTKLEELKGDGNIVDERPHKPFLVFQPLEFWPLGAEANRNG